MLSTAKSESVARDLKEKLEKRGFSVVESAISKGRKLAIGSSMSIRIQAQDAVSKDIFGNALDAFTPHDVKFAIENDAATHTEVAKVMIELAKIGFDLKIGEAATLAGAEAAADAASAERNSLMFPTKGA
jgi:hypothetical protein